MKAIADVGIRQNDKSDTRLSLSRYLTIDYSTRTKCRCEEQWNVRAVWLRGSQCAASCHGNTIMGVCRRVCNFTSSQELDLVGAGQYRPQPLQSPPPPPPPNLYMITWTHRSLVNGQGEIDTSLDCFHCS